MLQLCPSRPFWLHQATNSSHASHTLQCSTHPVLSSRSLRPARIQLSKIGSPGSNLQASSPKCYSKGGSSEVKSFREGATRIPTQGESLVKGMQPSGLQLQDREPPPDVDFLSVSSLLDILLSGGSLVNSLCQ